MSNVNNTIQFLITVETNISAHILPYVVVTTPSPQALEPISPPTQILFLYFTASIDGLWLHI